MGGTDQGDGHPILNLAAHLQVGLIPFHSEAAGCAFKCVLRLHAEDSIQKRDKGGEVKTLMEGGLQILLIIILLCRLKTLPR